MHGLSALLVIAVVAVVAPLVTELPIGIRPPVVVIEVFFGILVGPHALNLATPDGVVGFLGRLGLVFLFFLAGLELDLEQVRGRPLTLAGLGWLVSLVIALSTSFALAPSGFVTAPLLAGVALTTTALGTLLPILRDAGELDRAFGRYILGAGAMGEFCPVLVVSIVYSEFHGRVAETAVLLAFVLVSLLVAYATIRLQRPWVTRILARGLRSSSQLPVRLCILILVALVVLAEHLGLDVVLGAFAAGMLVGLAERGHQQGLLNAKLDAIGFGFLVPMFFVTSGMMIDLPSLVQNTSAVLRVPLFLALFLIVRGLPAFVLYRHELTHRERWSLALYSATGLPLVVAITTIGVDTGTMRSDNAAALVAAGMLSVLFFPLLSLWLRGVSLRRSRSQPAVDML